MFEIPFAHNIEMGIVTSRTRPITIKVLIMVIVVYLFIIDLN